MLCAQWNQIPVHSLERLQDPHVSHRSGTTSRTSPPSLAPCIAAHMLRVLQPCNPCWTEGIRLCDMAVLSPYYDGHKADLQSISTGLHYTISSQSKNNLQQLSGRQIASLCSVGSTCPMSQSATILTPPWPQSPAIHVEVSCDKHLNGLRPAVAQTSACTPALLSTLPSCLDVHMCTQGPTPLRPASHTLRKQYLLCGDPYGCFPCAVLSMWTERSNPGKYIQLSFP